MGLAIFGTSIVSTTGAVNAAPAPFFNSVIQDARNQLPQGLSLRLPSFLPQEVSKLYPRIGKDENNFRIMLYSQPGCSANFCTVGSFFVSLDSNEPIGNYPSCFNATEATLDTGIQGVYSEVKCGGTGDGRKSLIWEQDGLSFGLSLRSSVSRQEMIALASSMSSEPSIQPAQNKIAGRVPPASGKCKTGNGWVDNCWQGVNWQPIPNSYSDFTGGYDYVGANTIARSGDSINFDFYSDGMYVRYGGNCRTNVLAITRATDSLVAPNRYSPAGNETRSRALRFACSRR